MGRRDKRRQKAKRRLRRREFRQMLDVLFDDPKRPVVKYQNPDRWRNS